jgi:hypothetical protein
LITKIDGEPSSLKGIGRLPSVDLDTFDINLGREKEYRSLSPLRPVCNLVDSSQAALLRLQGEIESVPLNDSRGHGYRQTGTEDKNAQGDSHFKCCIFHGPNYNSTGENSKTRK